MTRSNRQGADTELRATVDKHLAAGEHEKIEEAWMAQLDVDPCDLTYFGPVAKALGKAKEADTARFLLELLDEQLVEREEWEVRLDLLQRASPLWIDAEDRHRVVLKTLDKIYGHQPSYQQMVEKVGLRRAVDDHPKTWKKVQRLAGLLSLDIGTVVQMEGKGVGRVEEVNMALESIKVAFEGDVEIRVGFGGATKLLQPLTPEHVLYRKLEDPESLIRLRDKVPGELLHLVFTSYPDPLTGAQIKRIVAGIVPEKKWNSWWTTARKHPQVIAAPGGKRAYVWAASSADAQDAVWEAFEKADARERLDMLRRDGAKDEALKSRMSEALGEQASELVHSDSGLACETWFHLERHGELPVAAGWSPQTLITETKDPRTMIGGIHARLYRDRAYELLREHRQDWPGLYVELMWQEHDARSLDSLCAALESETPQRLEGFLDQLLSQPRKNPAAFVWLIERAADRPAWLERNPIRMLKQILWVLNDGTFAPFRAARLLPLVESGGTVPRLLPHLNEEQAEDAATAIEKTGSLESYQRQPLINAIHLKYPHLREEDEAPLYATREKIAEKRTELKNLAEVDIPANRRAIEEAREMGDLRENFEYKSARQRHEYLSARASALNHDLARARPIDAAQVSGNEVVIGSKVQLNAASGKTRTITILGPWESEPEKDILSSESEMARSMLGLEKGGTIKIEGEAFKIAAIAPYE